MQCSSKALIQVQFLLGVPKERKMAQDFNLTAFIYDKRGMLLSMGKNSYVKTHPLQKKYAAKCGEEYKQHIHAEIHAIALCKNIKKAHRIVVMRFNAKGEPVNAKPCKICEMALSFTPIKIVEHT